MRKIIYIFILLVIVSCSNDNYNKLYKNYHEINNVTNNENWRFEKLSKETFFLPPEIELVSEKFLVVRTNEKNKFIKIFNVDNGELINSFGKQGQGPGEFVGGHNILYDSKKPKRFGLFDATLNRITYFKLEEELNTVNFYLDTIITISQDAGSTLKLHHINSNNLVGTGALSSRLCFYNKSGDTIKTNNYIPGQRKDKNISNEKHLSVSYQCAIDYSSKMNKIVICNYSADLLEIYYSNGILFKTIHGPDFIIPEYQKFGDRLKPIISRCGYTDLCLANNLIYCIYSGEKPNGDSDWLSSLGKNIYIFDSKGVLIKKAKSSVRINTITISEERNILYAICFNGEHFFIGYKKL